MGLTNIRYENRYIVIQELSREGHAISMLCSILGVSRAGYYKWANREKSLRETENEAILHEITIKYNQVNGIYGYRRLADEYNATHGTSYNDKRFYRLAKNAGLQAVIRRKRTKYRRSTPEITAANILNREFAAKGINEKWVTDITEMKYGFGQKAYLSAILDLKTREIVSFAMSRSNDNQLVFTTFDLALQKYPNAHPLIHSDRGYQYTSKTFKAKINAAQMEQSMSRIGRCLDNGPMEGFWGILKSEMYHLRKFEDYESLMHAVEEYIRFYNYDRRQRKLGRLTPMAVRQFYELAG